jgi:hypothetical protein
MCAKLEQATRFMQRVLGFENVHYRGLHKNPHRRAMTGAMVITFMPRRRLQRTQRGKYQGRRRAIAIAAIDANDSSSTRPTTCTPLQVDLRRYDCRHSVASWPC